MWGARALMNSPKCAGVGRSGARVCHGAESADAPMWEWCTNWRRSGSKIKKPLVRREEAYRGPRLLSGELMVFFYLLVFSTPDGDWATRGPGDQGTRGPGDQETRGPGDQGTRRPGNQEARELGG